MAAKFEYASFTRRFFSNVIDMVIIGFTFVVSFLLLPLVDLFNALKEFKPYSDYIFLFSIIVVYHTFFLSSKWKATPGKRLVKIKVVKNKEGDGLTIKLAFIRSLLALCFYTIFILLFTIPLFYLGFYVKELGYFQSDFFRMLSNNASLPIILCLELSMMYCFFYLFSKQRTIYDRISKSYVIISY